ncbi:hypothetical protein SCP_0706620 [Sparassis crispa]|uniref:Uncharacterized protein n=1 Tax=Sparassis crispa TaxID=139825 RepID=A0A401GTC6_9APHY|nr:hypothetical protein SCP_0706620 [Sparassis crispa]GBE85475.1 hypothetical protein SCP_0706620 [Sparassis crispa]
MLSAFYSCHYTDIPLLSLIDDSLIPSNQSEPQVYSNNLAVSANSQPTLCFFTEESELPAPIQNYCIVDTFDSAFPILAVNGVAHKFSLCESDTQYYTGFPNDVIFEAMEDSGNIYNYTTCYPVRLQVVYEA